MDQVLTRKDQLAMKEQKKEETKKAKDEKKTNSKAKAKAKSKAKTKVKDQAETEVKGDMEAEGDMEVEEEKKPRRRLKKMETEAVVPMEEPEDVDSAPAASKEKPKPRAKSAAKAKAKQEPKRKAKAKAKALAKSKDDGCGGDVEESVPRTPENPKSKALFQSDDDGDDGESLHERYDRKSRSVKPLKEILEKEEPNNHRKRQRSKTVDWIESAASKEEPETKPAKKKRKVGKGKGKNKNKDIKKEDLSPFAKKEKKRRLKAEKDVMQQPATPDAQLQGICLQHLKNVAGLTFEDVKAYLRDKLQNDCPKDFKIDEYWGRPACGIKVRSLGDGSLKNAPMIAYFKAYGTAPKGWNLNMALVYVSASLLVTKLISIVFGELLGWII